MTSGDFMESPQKDLAPCGSRPCAVGLATLQLDWPQIATIHIIQILFYPDFVVSRLLPWARSRT
jgi:hypothetical protein